MANKRGRPEGTTKLKPSDARVIRISYNLGRTVDSLALRFNVHISTIYKILRGTMFKDVDPPKAKMRGPGAPKGGSPSRRSMTPEQIKEMRALYETGTVTYKELAERFNVALSTAYKWTQPEGYQPIRKERINKENGDAS